MDTVQTITFLFSPNNYSSTGSRTPDLYLVVSYASFSTSLPDVLLYDSLPLPGCNYAAGCGSDGANFSYENYCYPCVDGNPLLETDVRTVTAGELDPTPLPAALPLFATGLGALGLFGWRRKRKNAAALAAA
jgi:hypothetical protein